MGGVKGKVIGTSILFVALALLPRDAASESTLVLGIRGNQDATTAYLERFPERALLGSDTREFGNGNTFVRFSAEPVGRAVEVLLPAVLTPDTLMEALIKIRTARASGAREVKVVLSSPGMRPTIAELPELDREDLFVWLAVAGADTVTDHGLMYQGLSARARKYPLTLAEPKRSMVIAKYHAELGAELAKALRLPFHRSSTELVLPYELRGTQVFLVAPAVHPVNETFFRTLMEIQNLKSRGATVVLVTPYLPYARSDKKDQPGVAVTGRFAADLLERAGIDAVSFARAHAPQSEGFFSVPVFHVSGRSTINRFLRERRIELVISPDAGFQKDASLYAKELGVDVVVLNKQRDLATGELKLMEMGGVELAGKNVAIIDDETATGGTLASAAKLLKEKGAARVLAVVTHLTGDAKGAVESGAVDELVVTNTLPVSLATPKLRVLSIAEEMAAALEGLVHPGECVRALTGG